MATEEKEPQPGAWTRSLHPNAEFQLRKPPVWPRFSNSNHRIYTVTGGLQYCDHLRPAPEGSVRWYAHQASSMCTCMNPRARWKMVHRSYLYMLSIIYLYIASICINAPYMLHVLDYGELYWQFGGKLYKDKSLIKNLFNLKSIKFFIIYVDTEHLSAKAPRTPGN